jgi:8-oxo-dGTP diphosphatase
VSASRRYPDRPFLAASVCVVRDGRALVAARGRPPLEGVFSLPGGLVEVGETLVEAALRELMEEVGVEADMLGFIKPVEVIERDASGGTKHHFVVLAHAARWVAGEPVVGEEALEVRWVTPADLAGMPTTTGLAAIVEAALARAGEA